MTGLLAVERLDAAIPALTASAEQAAERIWRNPHASIEVPRKPQWGSMAGCGAANTRQR